MILSSSAGEVLWRGEAEEETGGEGEEERTEGPEELAGSGEGFSGPKSPRGTRIGPRPKSFLPPQRLEVGTMLKRLPLADNEMDS